MILLCAASNLGSHIGDTLRTASNGWLTLRLLEYWLILLSPQLLQTSVVGITWMRGKETS
jgi:hypothetical protein